MKVQFGNFFTVQRLELSRDSKLSVQLCETALLNRIVIVYCSLVITEVNVGFCKLSIFLVWPK